jgi:hypothetical protein
MTIGVTLAPLFHIAEDRRTLDVAFSIAKRFGGHVEAVFAQPDPLQTIPMVGEGVSTETIRALMENAALALRQRLDAARATFDEACAGADLVVVEHPDGAAGKPSVAWSAMTGAPEDLVSRRSLLSDLVVFAAIRSEAAPALRATCEAVLLKARRPILVVPDQAAAPIGHNVAVAWNGTPEAAGALSAAMPFLNAAVAVHLLTAVSERTDAETLDAAADYLAWHGIGSERHVIEPGGGTVGAELMKRAVGIGADIRVRGG